MLTISYNSLLTHIFAKSRGSLMFNVFGTPNVKLLLIAAYIKELISKVCSFTQSLLIYLCNVLIMLVLKFPEVGVPGYLKS